LKQTYIFSGPLSFAVKKLVRYQKELLHLQANRLLKEKFILASTLISFYKTLPKDIFPLLRKLAAKIISMSGSTYVNESSFFSLKRAKLRLRANLSDRHLTSFLKLMGGNNLTPNNGAIIEKKHVAKSVSRCSSTTSALS